MLGVLLQCIQYSRREKCALGITKDNVLEFYHRRPSTGLSSYGFAEMKKKSIIRKIAKSEYIQIPNTKELKYTITNVRQKQLSILAFCIHPFASNADAQILHR